MDDADNGNTSVIGRTATAIDAADVLSVTQTVTQKPHQQSIRSLRVCVHVNPLSL